MIAPALRATALSGLKLSASLADRFKRPGRGVVVLIYHRVGSGTGGEVDLPPALFERQMEAIAAAGRAVALDDALSLLAGAEPPDRDPVVVTFDDGTADFADVAMPILSRLRVPATLYAATDFIERGRPFPAEGRPLSWTALSDALSTGLLTVGSHTHTHALLDRLGPAEAERELATSAGLIEDRLGVPAAHFAYPKALAGNAPADAMVRRRFRSAAVGGCRSNPYGGTDVHRLSRSAIQVADGMRWFQHKVEGGMELEDALRRRLNRRRYAGATS